MEVERLKVRQQCCAPSHSVAAPRDAPTPGNSSSRRAFWLKSQVVTGFSRGDDYVGSVLVVNSEAGWVCASAVVQDDNLLPLE